MKIVHNEKATLLLSDNTTAIEKALNNLLERHNILRNENIPNEEQVINEQDHIINNQEDEEFYEIDPDEGSEEGIQNDENFDTDRAERND